MLVGVFEILKADPQRPPWATDAAIQWALARWTRHPDYLAGVRAGKWRRLLDGTPVVRVASADRKHANETLKVSTAAGGDHERAIRAVGSPRRGSLAGSDAHSIPRGNA